MLIIGFVVGGIGTLIGAGGGFLLVPTLVLLDPHITPEVSCGHFAGRSFSTQVGFIAYARMGRVDFRAGTIFAIASDAGCDHWRLHDGSHSAPGLRCHLWLLLISACLYLLTTSREKADAPVDGRLQSGVGDCDQYWSRLCLEPAGYWRGESYTSPALTQALKFSVHKATATSHYVLSITALVATLIRLKNGTLDGHFVQIAWLSWRGRRRRRGAKLSRQTARVVDPPTAGDRVRSDRSTDSAAAVFDASCKRDTRRSQRHPAGSTGKISISMMPCARLAAITLPSGEFSRAERHIAQPWAHNARIKIHHQRTLNTWVAVPSVSGNVKENIIIARSDGTNVIRIKFSRS